MRRLGLLMNGAATEAQPQARVAALVEGLRQLGWTEGRNIRIDVRWNAGDPELARILTLIGSIEKRIMAQHRKSEASR
jgi:hypothetical protein